MFRVLHTADWHIDAQPACLKEKRDDYKKRRYKTAEAIADMAHHEKVEAVVIAGDLFDGWEMKEAVLKRTVEILNQFNPISVYIIPGNHDPLISDGLWESPIWKTAGDHVHCCLSETAVEIDKNVVLFPCPLRSKTSNEDPTQWIPTRETGDDCIRIGLAHGSLQLQPEYSEFPIDPERASKAGLNYLALGHWHSPFRGNYTAYSGGIEPIRHSEPVGGVTIVEIPDGHRQPEVTHHECGTFRWYERQTSISSHEDIQDLRNEIAGLMVKYELVLRFVPDLTNVEDPTVLTELESIRGDLNERIFSNEWQYDEYVHVRLSGPESIPSGILRNVWENLDRMIKTNSDEIDTNVARAALIELQRIANEVKP